MESLLDGTSSIMKFFIAFVVVFALIAVTAWLIRRFGTGTLGGMGTRGRAPRLAVIEAGAVDGRRKLVLIRRDNTEHLLMIGGPTDIVVEANIVRGQSTREAGTTRASSAAETLPRTLPAAEETNWPLQPEATPRNGGRATRPAALDDSAHWALPPEPVATPAAPAAAAKRSRSAETLAGLAAELSVRPAEPAAVTPPARPAPAAEAPRPKPAPAPAPAASSAAADQNLADMASRLEAALRRPGAPAPAPTPRPAAPKPAAETPRVAPPVTPPAPPVTVAPPVVPPVAPPTAPEAVSAAPVVTIEADKPANKPAKQPDDVFGSLEEEMANLLGRPDGKPS
jgi:flagellar protein FliO/FliZ